MSHKVYLKIIGIVFLFCSVLWLPSFGMGGKVADSAKPIDFTLNDINGGTHTLSAYKGKVVLLNFWATWCPPCREEMPALQKLYDIWDKSKYAMLAVNIGENAEVVKAFLTKNHYTFPILIDDNKEVTAKYGIQGIPTTYIIKKNGQVASKLLGSHEWTLDEINKLVK